MKQQVNLYQDSLNKNQVKPILNSYIYGLVLTILLFTGFSIYLFIDLNNTKTNLQEAQVQLNDAEIAVELLREQYPQQQVDPLIIQEISRMENILTSLSQVVHLLNDNKSDQTQGFSRYFTALSKQSISEVWLSNININAEENSLTLQGSTYITEKIPHFLQKLHHEPIFKGRHFAKLTMTQAKEIEGKIDFTVSTLAETSEKTDSNE